VADGRLLAAGTPRALRRHAYGGDVVDLKSPDLDWAAVQALSRLDEVRDVDQARHGWMRVLIDDSERATPVLLRTLETLGRPVEQVDASQPSFDDVFTRLVESHAQ